MAQIVSSHHIALYFLLFYILGTLLFLLLSVSVQKEIEIGRYEPCTCACACDVSVLNKCRTYQNSNQRIDWCCLASYVSFFLFFFCSLFHCSLLSMIIVVSVIYLLFVNLFFSFVIRDTVMHCVSTRNGRVQWYRLHQSNNKYKS